MYAETLNKLIDIMVDELGLERSTITETAKITSDLDINSLELLNVIMVIEEEFEVTLAEDRLRRLKTVGDITNYIVELKG